jgi:hypothetical protein
MKVGEKSRSSHSKSTLRSRQNEVDQQQEKARCLRIVKKVQRHWYLSYIWKLHLHYSTIFNVITVIFYKLTIKFNSAIHMIYAILGSASKWEFLQRTEIYSPSDTDHRYVYPSDQAKVKKRRRRTSNIERITKSGSRRKSDENAMKNKWELYLDDVKRHLYVLMKEMHFIEVLTQEKRDRSSADSASNKRYQL